MRDLKSEWKFLVLINIVSEAILGRSSRREAEVRTRLRGPICDSLAPGGHQTAQIDVKITKLGSRCCGFGFRRWRMVWGYGVIEGLHRDIFFSEMSCFGRPMLLNFVVSSTHCGLYSSRPLLQSSIFRTILKADNFHIYIQWQSQV